MIDLGEDAIIHVDYAEHRLVRRDLGDDGIIRIDWADYRLIMIDLGLNIYIHVDHAEHWSLMTSEMTSKSTWITQMRTYRLWPCDKSHKCY